MADEHRNAQRGSDRDAVDVGRAQAAPRSQLPRAALDDSDAARLEGDPAQDFGEAMGEDATFASDHARRPVRNDVGQGLKTRRRHKDIVSRRQ
jgi:hypothetical protein